MYFLDEAKIYLKGGDGGTGCISFRREKYVEMGGPDGGDGGDGGNIIIESTCHLNTLLSFKYKQHFIAANGENGKGSNKKGKSRPPLILQVPIGTQVFSGDGQVLLHDFISDKQTFKIIKGGKGGLGNSHFKSSTNQAPRHATKGQKGQEIWVQLKLKLLSEAGLIGLPNSGKSTFLSVTTAAKPRIADYPFTTLHPNLGVVYIDEEEFVLADIPGLIEGAHHGQGLGDKFLKHIERCGVLIHLMDSMREDIIHDYEVIRNELISYSPSLKDKIEIVCLNKCDSLDKEEINSKAQALQRHIQKPVFSISGQTNFGITEVLRLALTEIKKFRSFLELSSPSPTE